MLKKRYYLIIFFMFIFYNFKLFCAETQKDTLVFITGKSIKVSQLSKKEIKNIFLGKKRSLGDKTNLTIVVNTSEKAEKLFYKFLGKTKSKFENYWNKLIFTGRANPYKKINNDKELLEYIKQNPNSISFIVNPDTLKNIKKIKVIK